MTWTTIARLDAGDQLTSTIWNNQVKGNLEHLYSVPRCWAYKTSAQSTSTSTGAYTNVTFDAEHYDTASIHDTVTNNERFTLVRAGLWLVVGCVAFASNSTGERLLRMVQYDSGGSAVETVSEDRDEAAGSSSPTYLTSVGLAYTDTTTDYVTMQSRQNSGGNLNVNSGTQVTTVAVAWLGELF